MGGQNLNRVTSFICLVLEAEVILTSVNNEVWYYTFRSFLHLWLNRHTFFFFFLYIQNVSPSDNILFINLSTLNKSEPLTFVYMVPSTSLRSRPLPLTNFKIHSQPKKGWGQTCQSFLLVHYVPVALLFLVIF